MGISLIKNADFRRGYRSGLVVGITIFTIFIGYSVAAVEKEVPAAVALLFTVATFAAPAQYAVLDMVGTGVSPLQLILVGVMVNVRFFIMSLTMSHFLRDIPLRKLLPWTHCVAASTFLVTLFDKRRNSGADFFSFFRGVAVAVVPMTILGTVFGLLIHGSLPPVFLYAAGLFFPVYFTLLIVGDVRKRLELATVVSAFALTPPLEAALPGWGIVAAPIIVATASIGVRQWTR